MVDTVSTAKEKQHKWRRGLSQLWQPSSCIDIRAENMVALFRECVTIQLNNM